ncbi:MAG: hypothetical protein IJT24_05180 [Lachnospiraceae bacterium]|nr:hypothetical protein [Lachnospiraceae bacterium]
MILAVKAVDYQKENARLSQNNENLLIALNKAEEVAEAGAADAAVAETEAVSDAAGMKISETVSESTAADPVPLDQKTMGTIREYAEQGKSFLTTLKALFSDQFVLADEGRFYFKDIDPALRPYSYDDSKIQLSDDGIITYDDEDMDISYGIDVSQHNDEIDWETMKGADRIPDFVYVRAGLRGYSSGKLVADTQVSANLIGARELGSEVGVYFVTQAVNEEEAREEARFVIETLSDNKVDLPIALDVEKVENYDTEPRTKNLSPEEYTKNVLAFADEMKNYGYDTIVYGNGKTFMLMLDMKMLEGVDKWFADYVAQDDYIPYFPYDFSIWQFSSMGRVQGVTGDVDLNIRFNQ